MKIQLYSQMEIQLYYSRGGNSLLEGGSILHEETGIFHSDKWHTWTSHGWGRRPGTHRDRGLAHWLYERGGWTIPFTVRRK